MTGKSQVKNIAGYQQKQVEVTNKKTCKATPGNAQQRKEKYQ